MKLIPRSVALTAAMALLTSCGTIIEGTTDDVQIISSPQPAYPMACSATNERGSWSGSTPGSVTVKKSRTDLHVRCSDQSGQAVQGTLESGVEPWAIGSVVLSGLIGIGVDWISGAAYNYPQQVTVIPQTPMAAAPQVFTPAPVIQPEPVGALEPMPAAVAPAPAVAPSAPGSAMQPTSGTLYYYPPAATTTTTTTTTPAPTQPGTIAPLPFGGPTPAPAY